MHILIIRHGEPDYSIDSLTEKGRREAEILADRISRMDIKEFYVSPLGRAKDTAAPTLEKMNRTAIEFDWLREFPVRIHKPYETDTRSVAWDWIPEVWTTYEEAYSPDHWYEMPAYGEKAQELRAKYERVTTAFDALLAEYGYARDGRIYRVVRPNRDTIALFCHFGVACVLLSHLMHISPMPLWHNTVMLPASVTSIYTEERRQGIAQFRAAMIGDISHLYAAGEEPSFAARFCETYDCADERHD